MSDQLVVPRIAVGQHGWRVAFAGMGINLALGILYTWSVISKGIPDEWGWNETHKVLPYMFCCLIFSVIMVPAGRMQDKIGPRSVAAIGGILVGIGFIIASMTTTLIGYIIGFGVLAGAGIGFGYASATPPAVKWFPAKKTGMIAGIVVSGFGLASVYAAPLAKWLTVQYGLQIMMLVMGLGFLFLITGVKTILTPLWFGLSQMLQAPSPDLLQLQYMKDHLAGKTEKEKHAAVHDKENLTPKEMLCTIQFYMIWFMYACGAGAGLMIISKLAAIASIQVGISLGFILVAVLALGNGGGRILAGMLSDKIGRKATMFICFVSQAVIIFLLSKVTSESILGYKLTETNAETFNIIAMTIMAILSMLSGANYGANLALFPSITKDFYGLKNFGMNYGLVFTSWGVGGFVLAFIAGKMYDKFQTFNIAYYSASALLILAAAMVFVLRPPKHIEE
ncbi:MAG: L-lactate MFS transporter [Planctomycetota bacterium]|jgi:OFA family oxalate/formate antiporter-like MFS transporter